MIEINWIPFTAMCISLIVAILQGSQAFRIEPKVECINTIALLQEKIAELENREANKNGL